MIGCSANRLRRLGILDFKLSRRQRPISAARKSAPSVATRRYLLKRRIRRLTPTLAGATMQDRIFAALGALAGVGLATLCCWLALGGPPELAIVAPIGASAVLLFAVPASPLAQPWSVVGGNAVSALVGLAVGQTFGDPFLTAGIATALAIGAMSLARCLHPPGGAIALGSAIAGYQGGVRAFEHATPIVLTSVTLVGLGWVFHRFSKHSYPHTAILTRRPWTRLSTRTVGSPSIPRTGVSAVSILSLSRWREISVRRCRSPGVSRAKATSFLGMTIEVSVRSKRDVINS
jgi:CBS domain-containing membrane protein